MNSFSYSGGVAYLREALEAFEPNGEWHKGLNGKHTYRTDDGGVMNYWPSTGCIHCQGPLDIATRLDARLRHILAVRP